MAPAVMDTMTVDFDKWRRLFSATGSKVKFPGFMKVYVEGTDDGEEEEDCFLPEMEEGDKIKSKDVDPKQHFTQPPPRYTEARLVRALEEWESDGLRLMPRLWIRFKNGVT